MDGKVKRIGALSAGFVAIGLLVFVTMLSSPAVSDNINVDDTYVNSNAGDTCMTDAMVSGDAAWVAYMACRERCMSLPWWARIVCLRACDLVYQRAVALCNRIPNPILRRICLV